jgi:hypothetical protein
MFTKLIAILLGDLLKKKPYRLWGIKMNDKKWRNFGTGSYHRLAAYSVILFSEGWRTVILGKDIVDPAVPPKNTIEKSK